MMSSKPVIGLCGGIGSGKSAVAAEFGRQGCLVVDSDRLSHEVLAGPAVVQELRRWWGDEVVSPDGKPDRGRIARIVFSSADEKRRLEGLLYPLISARRAAMIRAVEEDPAVKAIVLDSPLLLESRLDRHCDFIVYVEADEPQRIARVRASRGWNAEELRRRQDWQQPLEPKRARADFVVSNNGMLAQLGPQITDILNTILARFSRSR